MDPPEREAAPVVDPCAEVLALAITLVAGLALIIPVLPPPCAPPKPPLNPPVDAPRTIDGAGIECGAITAWGMELSRATRNCAVEALGAARDAGAPAPRASEVGAVWT
jgi:hypothetical protein